PPSSLGKAGKTAWERALRAVDETDDLDRLLDAVVRYAENVDLAASAREVWRREGAPMTVEGQRGSPIPHPLLKVMQDADKLAHRFGDALGIKVEKQKHRGPDPKAVVQPQVGESPAAKLRRVK
ncbi:MAG: hypothetical protein E6Q97_13620, partial [Desulfurellales bacterium]